MDDPVRKILGIRKDRRSRNEKVNYNKISMRMYGRNFEWLNENQKDKVRDKIDKMSNDDYQKYLNETIRWTQ